MSRPEVEGMKRSLVIAGLAAVKPPLVASSGAICAQESVFSDESVPAVPEASQRKHALGGSGDAGILRDAGARMARRSSDCERTDVPASRP